MIDLKPLISVEDRLYDTNLNQNYIKSVYITMDGFSFCVRQKEDNKFLLLETYIFNSDIPLLLKAEYIKRIVDSKADLLKNVESICWDGGLSSLVPSPFFLSSKLKNYFGDIKNDYNKEHFLYNKINKPDAYLVYSIPNIFKSLIGQLWFNKPIIHSNTVFLSAIQSLNRNKMENNSVFINVENNSFSLLVVNNKGVEFFNKFDFSHQNDFVYFILLTFEQLGLNTESLILTVYGQIEANSALVNLLNKYVRHIVFGKRNPSYFYSNAFNNIPEHYFFNLLNQNLCV